MGVDIRLYLAPEVRINHVRIALGAMAGLPVVKTSFDSDPENFYVECPAVTVAPTHSPEFVHIQFNSPAMGYRSIAYFFEADGDRPSGGPAAGYRYILMRSTALNVAIAKRLVTLFGGRLVYQDCSDNTFGKPNMKRASYKYNAANDGSAYHKLQKHLASIKPLTQKEVAACAKSAAYDYSPTDYDCVEVKNGK